jgi:hypothetical protein
LCVVDPRWTAESEPLLLDSSPRNRPWVMPGQTNKLKKKQWFETLYYFPFLCIAMYAAYSVGASSPQPLTGKTFSADRRQLKVVVIVLSLGRKSYSGTGRKALLERLIDFTVCLCCSWQCLRRPSTFGLANALSTS